MTSDSYEILDKIAQIIKNKFSIHYIQIEGHTDSDPISSDKYPSNWELSGARASSVVRYLIKEHEYVNETLEYNDEELDKKLDELILTKLELSLKGKERILQKKVLKKEVNDSRIKIELFVSVEKLISKQVTY